MIISRGSEWNRWDLHLHTASSYDAKYKGADADELLCKALHDNDIKAVAITDYFLIDKDRIAHLRSIAPDIVFFPGVELRTDKGSNNLHLIVIFPEESNLDDLAMSFKYVMIDVKAKAKDSDETIYWDFDDIIEYATEKNGLISIHAGHKTNGMDREITNSLPYKMAIKDEIASNIHFFEMGQLRDVEDYRKYVFTSIAEKPIIMCSDCHDPRKYEPKEPLWIKGNLTFEGLKQCLYQPQERVFIGLVPPALSRVNRNKQVNIDSISVHRIDKPAHPTMKWFDFAIPLNSGMVAVIGNKGSGKSAFSDIVGHLCKSKTMSHASFLNENRFRKSPHKFADDYGATIRWADSHEETSNLGDDYYATSIEDAQYLPQSYIEEVCNDIEDVFQREIDNVIFSYVDAAERGEAINLSALVKQKSNSITSEVVSLQSSLRAINTRLIELEAKSTTEYRTRIVDGVTKFKDTLQRHDASKPQEVQKPQPKKENQNYQTKLEGINQTIQQLDQLLSDKRNVLFGLGVSISETEALIVKIESLEEAFSETAQLLDTFLSNNNLSKQEYLLSLNSPKEKLKLYLASLVNQKKLLLIEIDGDEGLENKKRIALAEKEKLIATANSEEKRYQKYLADLLDWDAQRKRIVGAADIDNTLAYYEHEQAYLDNQLAEDISNAKNERYAVIRSLFETKKKLVGIYKSIYEPIQGEIGNLLDGLEDNISFQAEVTLSDSDFSERVLKHINSKYAGIFRGSKESREKMSSFVRGTNFGEYESVKKLIDNVMQVATEDIDTSEKKISDKQSLYDYLCGLEYVGVSFKLKMGDRDLSELSPGERGIVLLIFYLALSQDNNPIIIDQPEDNLDNQSVFSKLVPCICKAKQKRQVIIVTHNPNIAVACDAEQIIYCEMNKDTHEIKYCCGAIEDTEIKDHVIDVLEGTMPAFDLRRQKYK